MPVHVSWRSIFRLLIPSFLRLHSASFEESILQLNSNSKYNIQLKAPPELVCTKIHHSGACLEINTALGFASCCIYLLTCPLMLYFPYSTHSGALRNIHNMVENMHTVLVHVILEKFKVTGY